MERVAFVGINTAHVVSWTKRGLIGEVKIQKLHDGGLAIKMAIKSVEIRLPSTSTPNRFFLDKSGSMIKSKCLNYLFGLS